ncbi:hypothetical protein HDU97_003438 [Phlyctochytrium planicorne]|nr:hypothetical protein HDU97_003438 [Phlyctochytrium planicorne]
MLGTEDEQDTTTPTTTTIRSTPLLSTVDMMDMDNNNNNNNKKLDDCGSFTASFCSPSSLEALPCWCAKCCQKALLGSAGMSNLPSLNNNNSLHDSTSASPYMPSSSLLSHLPVGVLAIRLPSTSTSACNPPSLPLQEGNRALVTPWHPIYINPIFASTFHIPTLTPLSLASLSSHMRSTIHPADWNFVSSILFPRIENEHSAAGRDGSTATPMEIKYRILDPTDSSHHPYPSTSASTSLQQPTWRWVTGTVLMIQPTHTADATVDPDPESKIFVHILPFFNPSIAASPAPAATATSLHHQHKELPQMDHKQTLTPKESSFIPIERPSQLSLRHQPLCNLDANNKVEDGWKVHADPPALLLKTNVPHEAQTITLSQPSNIHPTPQTKQTSQLLDLTDMICHEIRNPLAGLSGNVELFRSNLEVRRRVLGRALGFSPLSETETETGMEMDECFERLGDAQGDDEEIVDAIGRCADTSKAIADAGGEGVGGVKGVEGVREVMEERRVRKMEREKQLQQQHQQIGGEDEGRRRKVAGGVRRRTVSANLPLHPTTFSASASHCNAASSSTHPQRPLDEYYTSAHSGQTQRSGMHLRRFDPRQILLEVVRMMKAMATLSHVALRTSLPMVNGCECWGDPQRVQQVVVNLVLNAVRHTGGGGFVTVGMEVEGGGDAVGAGRERQMEVIRRRLGMKGRKGGVAAGVGMGQKKKGGRVKIFVMDTGCGMTKEEADGLFRKFSQPIRMGERTSGGEGGGGEGMKEKGFGLGLLISKRLVDSMGGEMRVDTVKGKGSSFYFFLEQDGPPSGGGGGGVAAGETGGVGVGGVADGAGVSGVRPTPIATMKDVRGLRKLTLDESKPGRTRHVSGSDSDGSSSTNASTANPSLSPLSSSSTSSSSSSGLTTSPLTSPTQTVPPPPLSLPLPFGFAMPNLHVRTRSADSVDVNAVPWCSPVGKVFGGGRIGSGEEMDPPTPPMTPPLGGARAGKVEEDEGRFRLAKGVVVVEDNPINQKILCRFLTSLGIPCMTANNGIEALDLLFQSEETKASSSLPPHTQDLDIKHPRRRTSATSNVEIVFMDVEMPLMDGIAATREIRRMEQTDVEALPAYSGKRKCADGGGGGGGGGGKRLRIVGLSGNTAAEQVREGLEVGMDEYIIKPWSADDIERVCRVECEGVVGAVEGGMGVGVGVGGARTSMGNSMGMVKVGEGSVVVEGGGVEGVVV